MMQQEMATESGRIVRFEATVVDPDGEEGTREVVRVGVFNAISNGKLPGLAPEASGSSRR